MNTIVCRTNHVDMCGGDFDERSTFRRKRTTYKRINMGQLFRELFAPREYFRRNFSRGWWSAPLSHSPYAYFTGRRLFVKETRLRITL